MSRSTRGPEALPRELLPAAEARRVEPPREEFRARASRGNLIPVHREILADLETPVSAFRKIADSANAFLLESVEHGERQGRFSFLGCDPALLVRLQGERAEVINAAGEVVETPPDADPLDALRRVMARYRPVDDPALPPFYGGAVGFLSYDAVRRFERLPDKNPDELGVPEMLFALTDTVMIFDHFRHRLRLVVNAHVDGGDADGAYDRALAQIEAMERRLSAPSPPASSSPASPGAAGEMRIAPNMTRAQFEAAVERCKEYILAGDAFQIVPSQRFTADLDCDPFNIYRALRTVNPSPYMFYLQFGDLKIAGSSPEILVRVENGEVTIRPIAGTRPRGTTHDEDLALEKDLLSDPKECAEHLMLVDLGRNDVGRVAQPGTVRVEDLFTIERYSHVMHIVSNVRGRLAPGRDAFDALRAGFPAGTLSGAPKIRAMEIIDEVETVRRGLYGGAVGYVSYDGNLDSCIVIRTAVMKDGQIHFQAGAGIVADSVPATEYMETISKAKAGFRAFAMARAMGGEA
ncbi:MAG: anthranilate synthase component I [Candidatus Sumerlaeia bacterium]|nr:anthranilate synthase component I [Candidatus Sumerlaeia bacterium]